MEQPHGLLPPYGSRVWVCVFSAMLLVTLLVLVLLYSRLSSTYGAPLRWQLPLCICKHCGWHELGLNLT